jgi:hypothetical protein
MWSSFEDYDAPVMHLAPWDEKLAIQEGAMHVCGEGCAQKLQSQFMGNVLENQARKSGVRVTDQLGSRLTRQDGR